MQRWLQVQQEAAILIAGRQEKQLPLGRMYYSNAGHDAPLLIDDGVTLLQVNANLPLGVFSDVKYGIQEKQLPPFQFIRQQKRHTR